MNWLAPQPASRIFAYSVPVDLRVGYIGLQRLVRRLLDVDPDSGDAFLFVSKDRRTLKCLLWDRTGWVALSKRLDKGRFRFRSQAGTIELDRKRLNLLLDGVPVGGVPLG